MNGEIIRIIEKESKYGKIYFDVLFKMEKTGSCFRSCIYTGCRNFTNWKDLLKVGNILKNLELIWKFGKLFIDADSFPELIRKGNPEYSQYTKPKRKNLEVQEVLFK